jgi:hypothetical protein
MKPKPRNSHPETPPCAIAARCQFSTSDGRTCRMLRWDRHPSFCLFHARREQQLLEADRVGAELVSLSGEFRTAHDLNHVLGKLFVSLANNRIPPRHAATLAYIAQLLLHSLPLVKREVISARDTDAWIEIVRRAFPQLTQARQP